MDPTLIISACFLAAEGIEKLVAAIVADTSIDPAKKAQWLAELASRLDATNLKVQAVIIRQLPDPASTAPSRP